MKINKTHHSGIKNPKTALLLGVIGIAILSGVTYAAIRFVNPTVDTTQPTNSEERQPTINLDPPTKDQLESAQQTKENSINQESSPQVPKQNVTVTVTAKNQNNSNNMLQIRTIINSILSSGTCTLNLIKDSSIVTRTAGIQAGPSDSTCQGFDIPLSELEPGLWTIKIDVASGSTSGSTTSEVLVNAT